MCVRQTRRWVVVMRNDLMAKAIVDLFCRASASLAKGKVEAGGAPALQSIVERNDAPVRRAEGLELKSGILRGNASVETEFQIAGVRFALDLLPGHKTGFYLDKNADYHNVDE